MKNYYIDKKEGIILQFPAKMNQRQAQKLRKIFELSFPEITDSIEDKITNIQNWLRS